MSEQNCPSCGCDIALLGKAKTQEPSTASILYGVPLIIRKGAPRDSPVPKSLKAARALERRRKAILGPVEPSKRSIYKSSAPVRGGRESLSPERRQRAIDIFLNGVKKKKCKRKKKRKS